MRKLINRKFRINCHTKIIIQGMFMYFKHNNIPGFFNTLFKHFIVYVPCITSYSSVYKNYGGCVRVLQIVTLFLLVLVICLFYLIHIFGVHPRLNTHMNRYI